ncbi:MAG: carbon storage regulator CsrA [Planctomycetes bacterium]|nr:carbon storage regulator CsrA [Planctomycetota bacterium]
MLVLSRRCGERLVAIMGGEIVTITILKIKGGQVRIGIEAPKEVAVHREELWKKLVAEDVDQRMLPIAG